MPFKLLSKSSKALSSSSNQSLQSSDPFIANGRKDFKNIILQFNPKTKDTQMYFGLFQSAILCFEYIFAATPLH